MRTEKLRALNVSVSDNGDEFYEVGRGDITAIEWGEVCGHMALLDTVRVFKDGKLHSEHVFSNCLGVYFADQEDPTNG